MEKEAYHTDRLDGIICVDFKTSCLKGLFRRPLRSNDIFRDPKALAFTINQRLVILTPIGDFLANK